jgi:hypothetical protein
LPEGWFLCDGSNGTPDLGDKYILGAATNEDIGEVAGAASHMHGLESHRHEATTPPHTHAIASWSGFTRSVGPHTHTHDIGDDVFVKKGNDDFLGVTENHLHPIGEAGAHAHELVFPQGLTSQDSGTGWTELNMSDVAAATSLPLYYKLAFIQKAPNGGIVMNSAPITTTPDPITRIEMLEEAVSVLSTHLILTRPFLVPGGAVGLWSGSLNALPAGWVLSDGTNGTLDLRDRFILGTVDSAGLEGGIQTHEHVLASHTHTVSFPHGHPNNSIEIATETRAETRHGHLTSRPIGDSEGADIGGLGDYTSLSYSLHVHQLQDSDAHEHYVELNDNILAVDEGLEAETAAATNTTSPADNLPPYYKLAFIVKLLENGD